MKKIIIDGTNLLHRSYHSSKKSVYEYSHIFHILRSLKGYCDTFKSNDIYICWDENERRERSNFRYRLIPEYKGQRERSESESVHQYNSLIYEIFNYLGIINIFPDKMEGDDIIAWLCLEYLDPEDKKVIVSSDKDFYQLINDCLFLEIYSPIKRIIIDSTNFEEIVGVDKKDFLKYKILLGDSSDNIRGIYKVGPVKAKKYSKDWKNYLLTLESEQKKLLGVNTIVMDLKKGYSYYPNEVEFYKTQIEKPKLEMDSFFSICKDLNLRNILNNKSDWINTFDRECNPLNNVFNYFKK